MAFSWARPASSASSPACSAVLEQLAQGENTYLIRLAINQGKPAASRASTTAGTAVSWLYTGITAQGLCIGGYLQANASRTDFVAAAEGCVRWRSRRKVWRLGLS